MALHKMNLAMAASAFPRSLSTAHRGLCSSPFQNGTASLGIEGYCRGQKFDLHRKREGQQPSLSLSKCSVQTDSSSLLTSRVNLWGATPFTRSPARFFHHGTTLLPSKRGRQLSSEAQARSGANQQSDAVELVEWVTDNGGSAAGVRVVGDRRGGLGLMAAQDVRKGQPLIRLPKELQLTYEPKEQEGGQHSAADRSLLSLMSDVPEELWGVRLGLKLLSERAREGSFWWPYISNLPQRFSVPIFFPPPAIADIQYPPVSEQVKRRCRFLHEFATRDLPHLLSGLPPDSHPFGGQAVDSGALGWAFAAVSSRAFRVRGTSHPASLLPLVDMCNHSFAANCQLRPVPGTPGALEVVANRDVPAGAPLELNYGPLSNDFLFMDYGFFLNKNPHDSIELRFNHALVNAALGITGLGPGPPSQDSSREREGGEGEWEGFAAWQMDALKQLHLVGSDAKPMVWVGGEARVDGRLVAAARVLSARSAIDLRGRRATDLEGWGNGAALNPENERRALRVTAAMCAIALSGFPTSWEEDEVRLKQELLPEQRTAVQFRMEKKKLLVSAINDIRGRLQALEPPKAATPHGPKPAGFGKAKGGPSKSPGRGFGAA